VLITKIGIEIESSRTRNQVGTLPEAPVLKPENFGGVGRGHCRKEKKRGRSVREENTDDAWLCKRDGEVVPA